MIHYYNIHESLLHHLRTAIHTNTFAEFCFVFVCLVWFTCLRWDATADFVNARLPEVWESEIHKQAHTQLVQVALHPNTKHFIQDCQSLGSNSGNLVRTGWGTVKTISWIVCFGDVNLYLKTLTLFFLQMQARNFAKHPTDILFLLLPLDKER
jgi:hypothetical protein